MTYWNFGHFFFFCVQVCDTQNVVKTARLFLIRCLFRGRFLFETWFFIFFEKIYPEIQFSTDVAVWYCYSRTTKNEKQKYMLPFLTWVLLKAMFVLLKIFKPQIIGNFFNRKNFRGKIKFINWNDVVKLASFASRSMTFKTWSTQLAYV